MFASFQADSLCASHSPSLLNGVFLEFDRHGDGGYGKILMNCTCDGKSAKVRTVRIVGIIDLSGRAHVYTQEPR